MKLSYGIPKPPVHNQYTVVGQRVFPAVFPSMFSQGFYCNILFLLHGTFIFPAGTPGTVKLDTLK